MVRWTSMEFKKVISFLICSDLLRSLLEGSCQIQAETSLSKGQLSNKKSMLIKLYNIPIFWASFFKFNNKLMWAQLIVVFVSIFYGQAVAVDYFNQGSWPSTCMGQSQSPIDVPCSQFINTCPTSINYQIYWNNPMMAFGSSAFEDLKTFFYNQNSWIRYSNSTNDYIFKAFQFHFHQPSEHHINGQSYPLEIHLVHVLDNPTITEYAVVGLLFEVDHSLAYDMFDFAQIYSTTNFTHLFPFAFTNKAAYHYKGSLTTPPCAQAVNWFVQLETIKITQAHMDIMISQVGHGQFNNRLIQRLNGRPVYLVGQGC